MSSSATQFAVEFKRRTIIPMVGVIFVAFALSTGLLYQVGAGQDERALEQSTKLLQTEIDGRQATLAKTLKDYSAWGEAYKNLHLDFSLEWAYEQGNAGETLFTGFGFNYVFLVDPNGRTIYSIVEGKLATVQAEDALVGGIASLIERARAAGENETVVETGVLRSAGDPVLVSVAALSTGDDPTVTAPPGRPSVLIFGDRLTPAKLQTTADRLSLTNLRATTEPQDLKQLPVLSFASPDGQSVALRWSAEQPGLEQMRAVLPWSAVSAVMLTLFVVFVLRYATRSASVIAETATKLTEARDLAHYQAEHDPGTGLPNRSGLLSFLDRALADEGAQLVLLYADLDRFKPINDAYGHPVGDLVLAAVAKRLQASVRGQDLVARFGGDEFLIAAKDLAEHDIGDLCQRLLREVSAPIHFGGGEVSVGLSIGIATAPTDATGAHELIRRADLALYQAKSEGGGVYRFFAQEMNERILEKRSLESDMRLGLARNEFVLQYQPRCDTQTLKIESVEALVRWQHPQRGLMSPGQFIALAEETGLIIPLGEWVLRTACETIKPLGEIGVSVNVSPVQFRTGDLAAMVQRVLAETGFPPERLELELTEGVLLEDTARAQSTLMALKSLGLRLSMDDFGTGYSSLGYLHNFPFDGLKIDQRFVAELEAANGGKAIVQAIVSLGKALGMRVTAEGVETAAQLKFLRQEACEEVQGFYTSRPMHADALAALVAAGAVLVSEAEQDLQFEQAAAEAEAPAAEHEASTSRTTKIG